MPVDGFYTEVREGIGIGFDVVALSGIRGLLSRIGSELPLESVSRAVRSGSHVL